MVSGSVGERDSVRHRFLGGRDFQTDEALLSGDVDGERDPCSSESPGGVRITSEASTSSIRSAASSSEMSHFEHV